LDWLVWLDWLVGSVGLVGLVAVVWLAKENRKENTKTLKSMLMWWSSVGFACFWVAGEGKP
jgi:hypothetical protein